MRRLAIVALVLAIALPQLAVADHVYSHRFVFEGRLIGGNGLPIPAQLVEFFAEGDTFSEPCEDDPHQPITNQWGDFRFCFHKHDLQPSTVVGVKVGNVTERKIMDTAFRRTIVLLRDYNATGVEPEHWNETFRIAGKAWEFGVRELEGVRVYGLGVPDLPVNLTLITANGTTTYNLTTDGFGDFDATLRLLPNVTAEDARIRVEARGETITAALNTVFHRNTIGLRVPPPDAQLVSVSYPAQPDPDAYATTGAPGSDAPRVPGGLIVGVAALVSIALWLKLRQKREE